MSSLSELNAETLLLHAPDVQMSELDGTLLIAAYDGGPGHCLDSVGVAIWGYLASAHSLGDLFEFLGNRYQVERNVCVSDTTPFVLELLEKKLLAIVPSGTREAS